jgi:hypothetical protein
VVLGRVAEGMVASAVLIRSSDTAGKVGERSC